MKIFADSDKNILNKKEREKRLNIIQCEDSARKLLINTEQVYPQREKKIGIMSVRQSSYSSTATEYRDRGVGMGGRG